MLAVTDKPAPAQSGLAALVLLLRFHSIGADPEQIRHRFGDDIGVPEMLRCAKEFGLKARTYRSSWQRLTKTPLPGIAVLRDGGYLLLGKASEEQVLVQDPLSPRPIAHVARRVRGGLGRPSCADGRSRGAGGSFSPLRHQLVPRRHPQIPPSARRGARRPRSSSSSLRWSRRCSSRSSSTRCWSVAP